VGKENFGNRPGFVGLPVAVALARSGAPVFDINLKRIEELRTGHDQTLDVPSADLKQASWESKSILSV
jgi:UDP-N-acetyl-D-glucosamine/UDP-N-acetyl-D-galactosamine dehydrogenase